jgi:hypothetical protein
MDIVDGQVHLFHKMSPEECLFAMHSLGIRSVLIDEVWPHDQPENAQPYQMLSNGARRPLADGARMASMKYPDRFKYLRRVSHRDPDLSMIVRPGVCPAEQ